MRRDVTAALRLTLQGHLTLRKSRLESFCVLVVGVLLSRTVNLSHLACMFPTQAAIASNYRRLQRFFEQVILDEGGGLDRTPAEPGPEPDYLPDGPSNPMPHYWPAEPETKG